jgi:hypothetical protein
MLEGILADSHGAHYESSGFWDMSYSSLKAHQRFGGIFPKHWLTFSGLHGILFQKKRPLHVAKNPLLKNDK